MRTTLKFLIFATIGLSFLAIAFPQIHAWLALSQSGIRHFYLWQLITYVLIEPPPLSFSFFLQLAFNMYLLWTFGSTLIERSRPLLFFSLYFGSALASSLISLLFPHATLAGATNALYAVLVAWMMLNPGSQLLLFLTIPFKAHWLIVALLGISFFIDISGSRWLACATLAASVLFGYFFSLIVWRAQSPFAFLRSFERKILRFLERNKQQLYQHSKIYDIQSGAPRLNDDQFMDAMLDRISRHGEASLTSAEKQRMREISKGKK